MKMYAAQDYARSVGEKGRYLLEGLRALKSRHAEIGEVDGLGLALRMEMCEADGRTPSRALADRMFQIGLEGDLELGGRRMGLVLDIGGHYKNVITLAPSL
jgi:4-aminobutyrate aminotransferase-like enzyme